MIATLLDDSPYGNKVPVFHSRQPLALVAVLVSLAYDYQLRSRFGGLSLNYFILDESCVPRADSHPSQLVGQMAAGLALAHEQFADAWMNDGLLTVGDVRTKSSWRSLWALTPCERLRIRCIIDAVAAQQYGLTTEDFRFVLRDCDHPHKVVNSRGFMRTLDPKGFWRVDKDQPPELRHTVLAQVAFHDLQAMGLEAFLAQHNGEGWMLPETLRLSDYSLGHDDRAKQPQSVASQFGDRFLPWQLNEDVAQSWEECRRHAENIRAIRNRFAPEPAAAAVDAASLFLGAASLLGSRGYRANTNREHGLTTAFGADRGQNRAS